MPSIDLKKYKAKTSASAAQPSAGKRINELLNRDINFGGTELADKKKEFLYMELSALLVAGIDLKTAFELVIAENHKEKDRLLFHSIQQTILNGKSFSQALEQTGRFSLYEVYSLRIGEESGKQVQVLQDLAKFYRIRIKQRRKIMSALTYPIVVLCTSMSAVFFMLKFVVPMFSDIFKRFGGQLPWITQKIIDISQAMEKYFTTFLFVAFILTALLLSIRHSDSYQRISSGLIARIPVIGNLVQKVYLARLCNAMRLLINAKLPLLEAISLSRKMVGYYPITTSLAVVESDILNGASLHKTLEQFPIYPRKMVQLLKVGEETNQMDYFFEIIADQYLEEIEHKTSTLSSAMEPVIIIFLGLVVGLILVAMYLPLFQLSNTFQ
jgi:type IV pilus assembly protein PilC